MLLAIALHGPRVAHASTACTTSSATGGTQSVHFAFNADIQCWKVPDSVVVATFDVYGAQGGSNASSNQAGGKGAHVRATLPVTPGSTMQIDVGGTTSTQAGGFNGGGSSAGGLNKIVPITGGGGGGASDVRTGAFGLADRVLVAGGGGGAGGEGQQCAVRGLGAAGGGSGADGSDGGDALPNAHGGVHGVAGGAGGAGGDGGND